MRRLTRRWPTDTLLVIQACISEAIVIYPLYSILFTERGGLSLSEVNLLLAIWIGSALLFELPTGLLADRFSRKYTVIIGGIFTPIAFVIWLLSDGFLGYAIGFLLWGIGYTFRSGAYQALVYDELAASNKTHLYTKIWSRIKAAEFIAYFVSIAMAAGVALFSHYFRGTLPFALSAVVLLVFGVAAWFLTRRREAAASR